MRLGSAGAAARPSGRPEIGGSGSPAPSTIRSGAVLDVEDEATADAGGPPIDCADGFAPAGSTSEPLCETSAPGGARPSPAGGVVCELTGSTSPDANHSRHHTTPKILASTAAAPAGERQHPHLAGPGS